MELKPFLSCLCAFIVLLAAQFSNATALESSELVTLPLMPEKAVVSYDDPGPAIDSTLNETLSSEAISETTSLVSYLQPVEENTAPYFPFGQVRTIVQNYPSGRQKSALSIGFVARSLYLNDQRIQWSGFEATFAGEGALLANYRTTSGSWKTSIESELFLNQPFEKNILLDNQERRSYAENYNLDILELSRLNIALRNGDWKLSAGKMWTPFGRHYSQLWTNRLLDAPFIRTEAIRWRETGILLRYDPAPWIAEVGVFNGSPNRDANSSKALVARIGAEATNWAVGGSLKAQDGLGSENQKIFNRHVGIDAMVRQGRWQLSTEVIYDEYGLRRENFDPLDIFWEKSIYFRELNDGPYNPITGLGYYVALDFTGDVWLVSLNYGQFFPETIGDVRHDRTQTRGILKIARSFGQNVQVYTVVMKENDGYVAQQGQTRRGTVLVTGLQYTY
ncbi:MAG: hypothetical protein GXP26_00075 [Planctomycetes bacterium]|nr:hypothetical protein [Planctomycetota bacterium]